MHQGLRSPDLKKRISFSTANLLTVVDNGVLVNPFTSNKHLYIV